MTTYSFYKWRLGAALLLVTSCRDATQLTLHVRTNVPCGSDQAWEGVAVYVGEPGDDVERASATLVTRACDESGTVGSLVVTPSGEKDGQVGLRVVAGITKNPEQCRDDEYQGCIVARRALRFTPHESLELDVELTADCVSIGCDAGHSCLAGRCVDTLDIATAAQAPPVVSGPSVRCGDDGVRCATEGDVCCLTVNRDAGSTSGDCRPAEDCPSNSIVLNCDDDTDCDPRDPITGKPGVCSLSYTSETGADPWIPQSIALATCRYAYVGSIANHWGLALCQTRDACADRQFPCRESQGVPTNPLPGYFWCNLNIEEPDP
jgi:hypothetical protein